MHLFLVLDRVARRDALGVEALLPLRSCARREVGRLELRRVVRLHHDDFVTVRLVEEDLHVDLREPRRKRAILDEIDDREPRVLIDATEKSLGAARSDGRRVKRAEVVHRDETPDCLRARRLHLRVDRRLDHVRLFANGAVLQTLELLRRELRVVDRRARRDPHKLAQLISRRRPKTSGSQHDARRRLRNTDERHGVRVTFRQAECEQTRQPVEHDNHSQLATVHAHTHHVFERDSPAEGAESRHE